MSGRLRRARFASLLGAIALAAAAFSGCASVWPELLDPHRRAAPGSRLRSRRRSKRPPAPGPSSRWGTSISRSIPSGSSSFVPKARLAGPTTLPPSLSPRTVAFSSRLQTAARWSSVSVQRISSTTPPLLITANSGRTWIPASPVSALAGHTDSLAVQPGGRALALTNEGSGTGSLPARGGSLRTGTS